MKMKNFYCFIGPKASVSTGITGLELMTLKKQDSTPTGEKTEPKDSPAKFEYLPNLPKNIKLER